MAGLRRLVTFSLGEEELRAEMARFAKNYLPILLNIYTSVAEDTGEMEEEGQRLAALETIKVYLQVSQPRSLNFFKT